MRLKMATELTTIAKRFMRQPPTVGIQGVIAGHGRPWATSLPAVKSGGQGGAKQEDSRYGAVRA